MAASNKQPGGSRPGPLPPHTAPSVKGGKARTDVAPGMGKREHGSFVKPTGANPRKMH